MVTKREESAENRRAEERREKVLFVRLHEEELKAIQRAARLVDKSGGEWARATLVDIARTRVRVAKGRK